MSDLGTQLPPGVHPRDRGVPWTPDLDANAPVGGDRAGSQAGKTRSKAWSTDNEEAMPVYQRAAHDWNPRLTIVTAATVPELVSPRQKGRVSLSLWVPSSVLINGVLTTTPAGVCIGSDPQEAIDARCVLNIGDSILIPSEGSVYVAQIPGQGTGYCQSTSHTNPIGGELGVY